MPEFIGTIEIPEPPNVGTFSLPPTYPFRTTKDQKVVVHTFDAANRKREQRFLLGSGTVTYEFSYRRLSRDKINQLKSLWESAKSCHGVFTFNVPSPNSATTTARTVRFADDTLVIEAGAGNSFSTSVRLVEVPSIISTPSYAVSSTEDRFPSNSHQTALLGQVQEIIPLVVIQPRAAGYPAIYVSNRRCTVAGQLYQPRLLSHGPIRQMMNGASDDSSFSLGNADDVITQLIRSTPMDRADVTLSLYNVTQQIKVNLWAGEISGWVDSESDPVIEFQASDRLRELRIAFPTRKFSATCWKKFNDGAGCPYASVGSLNGSYPSASPATCDKGYWTPNGCDAHNMTRYYGGALIEPQGVLVKDSGTHWGFGRRLISPTSIVDDSVRESYIPVIYTDRPFPIPGLICSVRDESTFLNALVAVCEGPVTFGVGHTLDGQFHHGYPGPLGLRTIPGTDPAGTTDFFSMGQSGNQVGSDPKKIFSGASTYLRHFSAGIAAIEIRRTDTKDIQPSRPGDHKVTVIVATGKRGWVWTAPGTRTEQTLTNPIWIAVDMFLLARGMRYATASEAESVIDIPSAIAAANFCDAMVSKVTGYTGTEKRFRFIGFVGDSKPLKDWLDEVLKCALAYYTFSNGKIRFGIRSNSTSTEAFDGGNILADSFRCQPRTPKFNHITGTFADEDFITYENSSSPVAAGNSVLWYDETHADLIASGSGRQFLTADINFSGVPSVSQAYRILSVLGKEELGGVTPTEWANSSTGTLRTTVLALNTEAGQCISITRPKYTGEARVISWTLNPDDLTIDIEWTTTTDSMYDALEGPQFADVKPNSPQFEPIPYPLRSPWWAVQAAYGAGDPLYPQNLLTFHLTETHETVADGSVASYLRLRGANSVNSYLQVPPPRISAVTYATSGGSLPSGRNYFVQVAPYTGNGSGAAEDLQWGPPSNVMAVHIPSGGSFNQLSITISEWPQPPTGDTWGGYVVLVGETETLLTINKNVTGSLSSPATVTTIGTFGNNALQPNFSHVAGRAKMILNNGIVHADITAVTSSSITCAAFADGGDAFGGRRLSILSGTLTDRQVPAVNLSCTSYNQSTGTFTVSQNPVTLGVQVGMRLLVRSTPTISNGGRTLTDSAWVLPAGIVGLVRIIAGTGRGQVRVIGSNTTNSITVDRAWDVIPDATSVVIIEEPDWAWAAASSTIPSTRFRDLTVDVPVDNLRDVFMLVGGFGVDREGGFSSEEETLMREIFWRGQHFELTASTSTTEATSDTRVVLVDAPAARDIELAPAEETRGQMVVIKRKSGAAPITLSGPISATVTDAATYYSDGVTYWPVSDNGAGGSGVTMILPYSITLTAAAHTITSPPGFSPTIPGRLLWLTVAQDTGNHVPIWSSDFADPKPEIDTISLSKSRILWISESDGKWHYVTGLS